jgi:hypothetical protein
MASTVLPTPSMAGSVVANVQRAQQGGQFVSSDGQVGSGSFSPIKNANTAITAINSHGNVHSSKTLLDCVKATIFNPNNPSISISCYVLLDNGSTDSYIHSNLATLLQLDSKPIVANIGLFGTPEYSRTQAFQTQFGLSLLNGNSIIVSSLTREFLTHPLPVAPIEFDPETNGILPTDHMLELKSPMILIGNDYYPELELTTICKLSSGRKLVHTLL